MAAKPTSSAEPNILPVMWGKVNKAKGERGDSHPSPPSRLQPVFSSRYATLTAWHDQEPLMVERTVNIWTTESEFETMFCDIIQAV